MGELVLPGMRTSPTQTKNRDHLLLDGSNLPSLSIKTKEIDLWKMLLSQNQATPMPMS